MRWSRRSQFTVTPSFSAKETAGNTTCARRAVSVRNSSLTITSSARASACSTSARSGALLTHSSPAIQSAFTRPAAAAARISGAVMPGAAAELRAPLLLERRARGRVGQRHVAREARRA